MDGLAAVLRAVLWPAVVFVIFIKYRPALIGFIEILGHKVRAADEVSLEAAGISLALKQGKREILSSAEAQDQVIDYREVAELAEKFSPTLGITAPVERVREAYAVLQATLAERISNPDSESSDLESLTVFADGLSDRSRASLVALHRVYERICMKPDALNAQTADDFVELASALVVQLRGLEQ